MNMVPLKSLDKGFNPAKPVLVKLSSRTMPEVTNKHGDIYNRRYEVAYDEMLLIRMPYLYTDNVYAVTVIPWQMDDMRARTMYFSSDFQVEVQSAERMAEFIQARAEYTFKNLDTELVHNFTIGSDPEIFVELNGEMLPAFEFLGSKEAPDKTVGGRGSIEYVMFETTGGCPMYWDGYQAEFTTVPGTCMEYHSDSIAAGLRGVILAARKKYPGAKLSARNVWDVPFERLMNDDEQFVAFGCMPSKNAYGLKADMPPAREVPFRSSGGHIHFGLGSMTDEQAIPIVKALDAIVGVACVSLFGKFDDPKRRILYGLPGEFRTPPHGVEYRPISSAWMAHPMITNLVFDLARKAVVFAQKDCLQFWQGNEKETIDCIISCDAVKAREILTRNKKTFLGLIQAAYSWMSKVEREFIFNIFMNGMESVIQDPSDFDTNWGMTAGDPWAARCARRNVRACIGKLCSGEKLSGSVPRFAPPA